MHILIADDDEIFSMMVEGICESLGHSSDVFTNGTETMEQVKRNETIYHAAILDVFMPGYNGDQIFSELSILHEGDFPVLFCTGLTDSSNWTKLQKLGNVMSKEKAMTGLGYEIEKLEEWALRLSADDSTRNAIMSKNNSSLYIKSLEQTANEARALLELCTSEDTSIRISNPENAQRLETTLQSLAAALSKSDQQQQD